MVIVKGRSRLDRTYLLLYFLLRTFGVGLAVGSNQQLVILVDNFDIWTLLHVFDGLAIVGTACDWRSIWSLMLVGVRIRLLHNLLLTLLDQETDLFEIFGNEIDAVFQ